MDSKKHCFFWWRPRQSGAGLFAGGASVHFHMLSPLSKGLFHTAISFSGVALNPWAIQDSPREKYLKLAKNLDCYDHGAEITPITIENAKSCLKSRDASDIIEETKIFRKWYFNPFSPFAPVVDSWTRNNRGFMPEHPFKVLQQKQIVNDVPWITSMTTSEGLYPGADYVKDDFKLFIELEEKWDDVIQYVLHTEEVAVPMGLNLISKNIRKQYFESKDNNEVPDHEFSPYRKLSLDDFNTLIKLLGDRLFLADYDTALRLHTNAASKNHVWAYRYNYSAEQVTSFSHILQGNNERYGVSHGDDVLMMFDSFKLGIQESVRTGDDLKMTDFLINMVVTFAKTGKPGINNWTSMEIKYIQTFLDIQNPNNIKMNSVKEFGKSTYWKRLFLYENELYGLHTGYNQVAGMLNIIQKREENKKYEKTPVQKNTIDKDEL